MGKIILVLFEGLLFLIGLLLFLSDWKKLTLIVIAIVVTAIVLGHFSNKHDGDNSPYNW